MQWHAPQADLFWRLESPTHRVNKLYVAMILVLFMLYPILVRTTVGLFACIEVDGPSLVEGDTAAVIGSYWSIHMQQQCWQGKHFAWALGFGAPFAIVLLVLVPSYIIWSLDH